MTELVIGSVYLCADNSIRRLRAIEEKYLYYDVPIGTRENLLDATWIPLSGTIRQQVENEFTNGSIIDLDALREGKVDMSVMVTAIVEVRKTYRVSVEARCEDDGNKRLDEMSSLEVTDEGKLENVSVEVIEVVDVVPAELEM